MRYFLAVMLGLAVLGGRAAADDAADVAAGWAAYQKGDHARALKILKPLAEAGNADAQYDLGSMYSDGHGVPRDPREAKAWWEKAANQGQTDAEFSLGFLLLYGAGEGDTAIAADPAAGLPWIEKAGSQGSLAAQQFLAYQYWSGTLLPADQAKAVYWASRMAESGRPEAEYQAGTMLASIPGANNAIQAYKWLDLAARQNYPGADKARDKVGAERLNPDEVARARALADSWKPAAPGPKS